MSKLTALLLLGMAPLGAQTFTGSILGYVRDSTGAVMPNVTVRALETSTNSERSTVSNESGFYEIVLLPPGTYRVQARHTGFKSFAREGLKLDTGLKMSIDVTLSPGDVNETIEVTGETPLLETSSSTVAQLIDNTKVTRIPLSNRNLLQLINLIPGVNDFGAGVAPATSGSVGFGRWSSNGGQVNSNEFMLDGATAILANMNAASIIPTLDAIEEFKIHTNAMAAEFGRTGGAVVNATYKSGTNELHGVVYDFWRNRALNANNWLNNRNGRGKDFTNIHTFGYTVGGPVLLPKLYNGKNRTFFFHNYEGYRDVLPTRTLLSVPTVAERGGDFSGRKLANGGLISIYDPLSTVAVPGQTNRYTRTAFPGNIIPANRMDPVGKNLAGYYPDPNTAPADPFTNVQNFIATPSGYNRQTSWSIKVDHTLTANQRLFFRYSHSDQGGGAANLFGANPACSSCLRTQNPAGAFSARGGGSDLFVYPKNAVAGYTNALSPSLVLDLRYSLNRQLLSRLPQSSGFDITTLGFPKALAASSFYPVFPPVSVENFEGLGTRSNGDLLRRGDITHSLQGSLTKIRGAHTMKFGGDIRNFRYFDIQANDVTPSFSFNRTWTQQDPFAASTTAGWGMASMLLGTPASGNHRYPGSIAIQYYYGAAYFQDDWRVNERLTLNIGVRWDIETPFTERFNRSSTFDLTVRSVATDRYAGAIGGLQFMGKDIQSRYRQNVDKNNWNPRFGLAYKLTKATVLRAAYGIFFQPNLMNGYGAVAFGATGFDGDTPFVPSVDGGLTPYRFLRDPFPDGYNLPPGSSQGAATLIGQGITTQRRDVVSPYSQQFNLGVQHEVRNWLVDVGYVGSHGVKQFINVQMNQLPTEYFSRGADLRRQVANPFLGLVPRGTFAAATLNSGQLLLPYPQFTDVQNNNQSSGNMNYHSLQTKLERRFSKGYTVLASYTWSKNIGDVGERYWQGTGVQNQYDLRSERGLSPIDIPHRLTLAYVWELPFGKGKTIGGGAGKGLNMLIGGWQMNGVTTFQSGTPLAITNPVNQLGFGAGSRPVNLGRSAKLAESERNPDRWFDTTVFAQPAPFTFGNTTRYSPDLRGPGVNSWTTGFFKDTHVSERFYVQFRAEFFNLFNHPLWGAPGTTVDTPLFGRVTSKTGNRTGQLGLKVIF
ncbi:MAG: TonB-dependent receptor [Acidobacteria bacterium]|nr:TonB-dependent receptor [Acidobacteriota bacterium]